MLYDVYLRKGRETLHMYRYTGSPDPERASRQFQETIAEAPYATTINPEWDRMVLFPVGSNDGRSFLRLAAPKPVPWFS